MSNLNNLPLEEKLHRKYENIFTSIFDDSTNASKWVAAEIAKLIKKKAENNETCVLGLATGSSPIGVYKELVRLHQDEGLSFKNVVTFNLDEYYPMTPDRHQSYVYFMHEHLFDHVNIPAENINIPDGTISIDEIYDFCQSYEQKIQAYGGLDLQILGIGRTGHIGFNEPGSSLNSPTRLISLDSITIADAAGDFHSIENVPTRAITMGIETIMKAERVILMAWGEKKASVIKEAIEGLINERVPATYLQMHKNTEFILDAPAASELTRINWPWMVRECRWDDRLEKKATTWLCQKLDKPILKLTNRDYNDNALSGLLAERGSAYNINIKVFNSYQHTITGWPGGKPNESDKYRPERAEPFPKKVLVFSPHPDDDIFSMGGTLIRLVEQGHEVYVAYQTSGNISVSDDDAMLHIDFIKDFENTFGSNVAGKNGWLKTAMESIQTKKPGDTDTEEVRKIKTLVRKGESKSVGRFVGIPENNIRFLEMPFYETGTIKKADITDADIQLIVDLLKEVQPHQIYAAGDLTDPHGTHRKCLNAINEALTIVKDEEWTKNTWVWLYKGAWQEINPSDADMAVPLSPGEFIKKRAAVFMHRTQKEVLHPGHENKEVWRHIEERNINVAKLYDKLGMAEYEAMETFTRYQF